MYFISDGNVSSYKAPVEGINELCDIGSGDR